MKKRFLFGLLAILLAGFGFGGISMAGVVNCEETVVLKNANNPAAIAQIEDTCYDSLQDAIDTVESNDTTITLLDDIILDSELILNTTNSIILDFDGHTLTGTSNVLTINAGDITITGNGTMELSSDGSVIIVYNGNCTIENGTLIGGNVIYSHGENSVVTINTGYFNGTRLGNAAEIHAVHSGTINIYGGTFIARKGQNAEGSAKNLKVLYAGGDANQCESTNTDYYLGGTINVYGGHFEGRLSQSNGGVYNIMGGTFIPTEIAKLGCDYSNCTGGTGNPTGCHEGTMQDMVAAGYIAEPTENPGEWTVSEMPNVAQIGDTTYKSLREAIAAANENNTIEMLADDKVSFTADNLEIGVNKSITIDGKGYTLYGVDDYAYNGNDHDIFISGDKDITIKNLKISEFASQHYANYRTYPIRIAAGYTGKLTLKNVTIDNFNRTAINAGGGTVEIDGCTITGDPTSEDERGYFQSGIESYNANVTVKDTTITGVGAVDSTQQWEVASCVQLIGQEGNPGAGTITLNGVTCEGQYSLVASERVGENGKIIVESGAFKGDFLNETSFNTFAISGGKFSQNPSAYVVSGKYAKEIEDGTYNYEIDDVTEIEEIVLVGDFLPMVHGNMPVTDITTNTTGIIFGTVTRGKGDECSPMATNETFSALYSDKYCLLIPFTVQTGYALRNNYPVYRKNTNSDRSTDRMYYSDDEYNCTSSLIKITDLRAKYKVEINSLGEIIDTLYREYGCSVGGGCGWGISYSYYHRDGYTIGGYYTDPNFTDKWGSWEYSGVKANMTLYIKWLEKIMSVSITGVVAPIPGEHPNTNITLVSPTEGITLGTVTWYNYVFDYEDEYGDQIYTRGDALTNESVFEEGKHYKMFVDGTIDDGYTLMLNYSIGSNTKLTINGILKGESYIGSSNNKNFTLRTEEYIATAPTPTTYTITWKNGNDTLKTDTVNEGETPSYSGTSPTKAEDSSCTYTFYKWSPDIVAATANATYTATFTCTPKQTSSSSTSSSSSGGGNGGGNGGGSTTTKPTEASTGDTAATNTGAINTEDNNNVINNPTEGSNQQDNPQTVLADGFTQEFHNAYEFAFKNGITTMPDIQNAAMYSPLTRIAMAKMLVYYAINVLHQTPNTNITVPEFPDVPAELNEQYGNAVTLAYQLGIMGINIEEFRPFDEVTRAEFGTALSRMLYGTPDGDELYYEPHLAKLMQEKIITNDDPNLQELRGYVMIMLKRSAE